MAVERDEAREDRNRAESKVAEAQRTIEALKKRVDELEKRSASSKSAYTREYPR